MPARRPPTLRPAFVVVAASASIAVAACDSGFLGIGGDDGGGSSSGSSGVVSHNPPPPEPIPPPKPDFGATVSLDPAPPPLGGASLLVSDDGRTAVATDPDRDRVLVVDLGSNAVKSVALAAHDEPGRIAADDVGRVHVVLDGAGAVATIDLATASVVARRQVCASPHGITRSGATLFVACSGGELVRLPSDPAGAPALLARLEPDLRDVVALDEDLLVSRLRSAQVLRVHASDGSVVSGAARASEGSAEVGLSPFVAWRLVPSGDGGGILLHQMAQRALVDVEAPQAYAGLDPCGGSVLSTITTFTPASDGALVAEPKTFLGDAVAPVDLARSRTGRFWAVIAAGNGHTKELPQVQLLTSLGAEGGCTRQPTSRFGPDPSPNTDPQGQAVAVAFTPDERLVVFSREPAALYLRAAADFQDITKSWQRIELGGPSREDTGHAIFHSNTGGRIACVSCHPGGGDDGRVWQLSTGPRRTQSLQGTLDGTAPYHWNGDATGIDTISVDVFSKKMGGQTLSQGENEALRSWLVRLPAPKVSPAADAEAALRGKALFESAAVGCAGCHSGPKLTNNETVDVGTGGAFQVPSLLGLGVRAPYLHDGRAATLLDRFGPAGGEDAHGTTSQLDTAAVNDLVRYLESL